MLSKLIFDQIIQNAEFWDHCLTCGYNMYWATDLDCVVGCMGSGLTQ